MMLILIASAATPPTGRAFIPSGYQSYYVLGDSESIVKKAMDPATGYNNATSQPWSLFSIVSYLDMATIYVDQRQNGYGFDTSDFSGADAIFEIDMGAVLTMTNWGSPPYYTITPPGSGHLVSGSLDKVDGGDFFFIAGGPVNVIRGVTDRQPGTGPLGNYITEMWSVFPVEHGGADTQKSYVIPVGENTPTTQDFKGGGPGELYPGGTFAVVQATADGTVMNYTRQGVPLTKTLSRGESFVITHVWHGDTIRSNNKVQVVLLASGGKSYDFRAFSLHSDVLEGSDFWIPTFPTDNVSAGTTMPVRYHIYAITDADVTIETNTGIAPGWNPRNLAAGTVDVSFTTNSNTMAHIYTQPGQRVLILVSVDTNSGERDWGYVPLDSSFYSTDYFVPYAPSGLNHNEDEQIFVTPIQDNTQIQVDFNQDGVFDESVVLDRLQSYGFYDPTNMDMTGAYLHGNGSFTTVYGESIFADSGGDLAGYDWGYTLIPLDVASFNAILAVNKTATPSTAPVGETITFTATIKAGNWTITDLNATDTLPTGFTYRPGSTNITHPDLTVTHQDPETLNQTLTWELNETLTPNQTLVIAFQADAALSGGDYENLVAAEGRDPAGNVLEPEDTAPVRLFDAGIVSGTLMNVTDPVPVPDITVWLYDATDNLLNTTQTDNAGHYKFTGLAAGTYHVKYDASDPDMRGLVPYSDDDPTLPPADPLTTSADFALPAAGSHVHDFEAILTVDLKIVKTGPAYAVVGDHVTYSYTVTNLGDSPAKNVAVADDLCGPPDYASGDANGNGLLEPGETWVYTCGHTVGPADPNPLKNTATVTTSSLDADPSNNVDDWEVTIYGVGMLVEKTLTTPATAPIGGTVKFNVTITNTGTVPLLTVPLHDQYDTAYLDYQSAAPAPDAVDETTGTLDWNDLTGAGSLPPGSAIKIQLTFKALKSTGQSVTVNTATVTDASAGQFGTVSGSAAAHVKIAAAVGGEVTPPDPTGARATALTILLLVGAAAYALTRKTP
jgi:uncharacterized repeat protein (TIGR01451 family)